VEHDIWSATPLRNDVLKLADLPDAPETYDEFYDGVGLQVERIPSFDKVILNTIPADSAGRLQMLWVKTD